jgi:transcriptional regulator with XRE-family HTH domain
MHHTKHETVNFIVPERLRNARLSRALNLDEAADLLGINKHELGRMENGHQEIPKGMLFKLMSTYNFPRKYFYTVFWERV